MAGLDRSDPDGTSGLPWSALIGSIAQVRLELAQLDSVGFPMSPPGVGASPAQLEAAEQRLRHPIDRQHRSLLEVANGWDDLFIGARLLAVDQLGHGPLWEHGQMLLETFFGDGPVSPTMPERGELELLAVGVDVVGVHVLWITGPLTLGGRPVLWLDDSEVQRWPNAWEWARSAHAYLERHRDMIGG